MTPPPPPLVAGEVIGEAGETVELAEVEERASELLRQAAGGDDSFEAAMAANVD